MISDFYFSFGFICFLFIISIFCLCCEQSFCDKISHAQFEQAFKTFVIRKYGFYRDQPLGLLLTFLLCMLLLSRFSRVRLCATPQTAAHQAPLSLGFSRQEYWGGLPFPSPMHVVFYCCCMCVLILDCNLDVVDDTFQILWILLFLKNVDCFVFFHQGVILN